MSDLTTWKKDGDNDSIQQFQEENSLFDLRSQINRLFDDFFTVPFGSRSFFSRTSPIADFAPRVDISETEKELHVSAELPGLEPNDINISIDHNTLTMSGEKRTEKEDKGERYYQFERSYGSFHRSIPLPFEVDEDNVDATFKSGVLNITLPKSHEALEKGKQIKVKKG